MCAIIWGLRFESFDFCCHPGSARYLLVAGNASVILAHGDEVAQIKSGAALENL